MYWTFDFAAWDTRIAGAIEVGEKYDKIKLMDLEKRLKEETKNYEKICSRFDETSEITALNKKTGTECAVSKTLMDLLIASQKAHIETNGIFDPTILPSLESAGYDKTFPTLTSTNEITTNGKKHEDIIAGHLKRPLFDQIILDEEHYSAYLPPSMQIDLGGIAKGHWVDYIVKTFFKGSTSFWLSAGGDIYLQGQNEKNTSWDISLQDPFELSKDLLFFKHNKSQQFGVATSSTTKRKGVNSTGNWHHIIDPCTGLPSKSDLVSASICAPSVVEADVYAKTAVILGSDQACLFLSSRPNCEYLLVDVNKKIYNSPNLNITYV